MAVGERERRELQEALVSTIGPDPADTLLSYLPPVGWADVATKRDLETFRVEFRGELDRAVGRIEGRIGHVESRLGRLEGRIDGLEARIDGLGNRVDGLAATLASEMHRELRTQFYWLAGMVLAVTLALAAVGRLG